jgi:hypothetical protein
MEEKRVTSSSSSPTGIEGTRAIWERIEGEEEEEAEGDLVEDPLGLGRGRPSGGRRQLLMLLLLPIAILDIHLVGQPGQNGGKPF